MATDKGRAAFGAEMVMRTPLICALALFTCALFTGAAFAAVPGVTTANVNLRAGPGTSYPALLTVPNRSPIVTYGCLAAYNWCDVSWGGERGWMSASYIDVTYQGRLRTLTATIAPALGIAVVPFNRNYWNRYYSGRPWYRDWDRYYRPRRPVAVQPLPPNRPPPAGRPRPPRP